jgi:uncharacterized RDD family membrane protein YckC
MGYEVLLLSGVLFIMAVPLLLLAAKEVQPTTPVVRIYIMLGLALYFLWHWSGGRQTLAMRTWKLLIVTPAGNMPPLWRLTLRYIFAWPSLFLGGIGILWALVDHDRQFLHDRLAGTRIIFAPPTRS